MMKNDRAKVFRPPPLHYNPPILPHPCFCQSSNLKKSKMHFEWAYHNTILFLFLGTRGLDGKEIPLLLKKQLMGCSSANWPLIWNSLKTT